MATACVASLAAGRARRGSICVAYSQFRADACSSSISDPLSLLRPLHRLWRSSDLYPEVVALHSLQHPLRTPATPCVLPGLGSPPVRLPSFLLGVSSAFCRRLRAFRAHGGELRLHLALRPHLSAGGRGQLADAQSTRT